MTSRLRANEGHVDKASDRRKSKVETNFANKASREETHIQGCDLIADASLVQYTDTSDSGDGRYYRSTETTTANREATGSAETLTLRKNQFSLL